MSISVNPINYSTTKINNNLKKNNIKQNVSNNEADCFVNTNFKGKTITPKAATKTKDVVFKVALAIASFFGYESAKEIFLEKQNKKNDAKLMVLKGSYPEVNKELEANFDKSIRGYILEAYNENKEKGEKLLDIFYKKDLNRKDFRFLEDLNTQPELLDKKHAECLINGKSQRSIDAEKKIVESKQKIEIIKVEPEKVDKEILEDLEIGIIPEEKIKALEVVSIEPETAEVNQTEVTKPEIVESIVDEKEVEQTSATEEEINAGYMTAFIDNEFKLDQGRGEKLLDIFYGKDLDNLSNEDKQFIKDYKLNPEILDEKHKEYLINGKSLRQRDIEMAEESSLRLNVKTIESDIIWNENLLEKARNDRKKINHDLTQCHADKAGLMGELKALRRNNASKEAIAKKEAEFEIARTAVGDMIAKKKEINAKIAEFDEKIKSLNEELAYAKSDLTAYVTKINNAEEI